LQSQENEDHFYLVCFFHLTLDARMPPFAADPVGIGIIVSFVTLSILYQFL